MICIHPTATHNASTLTALELRTGLNIIRGNTFLRLEPGERTWPAPRPNPGRAAVTSNNGWTPGGAA